MATTNITGYTERAMTAEDIPAARALVESTEGLSFRPEETNEAIVRLLQRNPGASRVAINEAGELVGCVFIGDSGLRGMINHLAVRPDARGRKLGTLLTQCGLIELYRDTPVRRIYSSVLTTNPVAQSFWTAFGFRKMSSEGGDVVTFVVDLDEATCPWLV